VVVRGTDGALYWQWYRGAGNHSGWQRIDDGITVGQPAVCSTGEDILDVFARGGDDACWYRRLDPAHGGWQPWVSLGGVLTSEPATVAWGNVPVVVVRGTDGALYWQWYRGAGNHSGWQRIDDGITRAVTRERL